MTNLLSRFLAGATSERRRSAASATAAGESATTASSLSLGRPQANQQQQQQQQQQQASSQQEEAGQSARSNSRKSRRSSRSSIHSVSAMFVSAITGTSQQQANGRSMMAKNKEDTVIAASASPTIVQKESTESGVSVMASTTLPAATSATSTAATISGESGASKLTELAAHSDQASKQLEETIAAVRLPGGSAAVLALAAAAAQESPNQQLNQQLSTVATLTGLGNDLGQVHVGQSSAASGHQQHAPLNASSTIKQAPHVGQAGVQASRRPLPPNPTLKAQVIKVTELLLNAINRADYETYASYCDPHMTSFEPENLGNLIDNMAYRRLVLDQARQMQLNRSMVAQSSQQVVASAVSAALAATKVTTNPQQVAMAAAQAALAGLSLEQRQPSAYQQGAGLSRQHSLMLNPSVYLLNDDAASIAYQKLSQTLDPKTGAICNLELSEETRVWHRNQESDRWLCVHFHRSLVRQPNNGLQCGDNNNLISNSVLGPQTSVTLIKSLLNEQQLDDLAKLGRYQDQQNQQQQTVPSISLNHNPASQTGFANQSNTSR